MDEKINNVESKTEQAKLMGIKPPKDGDWANYSSKTCGSIGGANGDTFTEDAVSSFECKLVNKDKKSKA